MRKHRILVRKKLHNLGLLDVKTSIKSLSFGFLLMGVLTIAVLIFMLYLVFLVLDNFTIRPWQIFVGIISLVIFVRLITKKKRKPTSNIEISEEKKYTKIQLIKS